ncbi:uncharacterized protein LOC123899003 [Trifolium pratense]|uniref:uncharacterized protein LOC123899003 n=1 Tax=Trifolium pratense TaxID=57577 RepID=UPI0008446C40|nr:uncharacterized protein LOC123899003 [Trifolium pratense]
MGNCLKKNQISSSQDHENEEITKRVEKMKKTRREDNLKKKVRFKVQDDNKSDYDGNSSTSGILRIRLVVSKEELKRVLSNKSIENGVKNTTLEELLKDMKLKDKNVSKIEEVDGGLNSWRPDLDSIPEDYSMK